MIYVYVLFNKENNKFYFGLSKDLRRRIEEHNRKKSEYKLIFYEAFIDDKDARKRERYFKTTKGKRTLKLLLKNFFRNSDSGVFV